ncbi:MAG: hypothetical protein ACRBB0_00530 [Pelagimonas sp.]|uniref:hypothetical protein n=1 Tax=Pelagimonas sp. TaxID=2073170 RepID=UPI003D6A8C0A
MDVNTIIAFAVTFVVGPALCAWLLRLPPRLGTMAVIGLLIGAAIWAAVHFQNTADSNPFLPLIAMWLAWVLGVGMVGLALLRPFSDPRMRRWITFIALMATTLPWFGLATAQMMA